MISDIYDQAFFEWHMRLRDEYEAIADWLLKHVSFDSVLDLGCGNAFMINRMRESGKDVRGIDGSTHSLDFVPPEVRQRIMVADLSKPLTLGQRYDLVICTEVAEHLEKQYANLVVETICAHARGLVFFTAATPGQGGNHHYNEQPHQYWVELFDACGFVRDSVLGDLMREELAHPVIKSIPWIVSNAMFFRG